MSEVAELMAQLRDAQIEARTTASEQLCHMGVEARRAATALVSATGDEESVSQWAVAALEELGPPEVEAASELAELSKDSHELVSYWAITLLGRLGADGAGSEAALVSALRSSPHDAVRQRAAWALGKLGPLSTAATDLLRQTSQASNARLARLATQALEAGS